MSNSGYHKIYWKKDRTVEEKIEILHSIIKSKCPDYEYNLSNWDFEKDDYKVKKDKDGE